MANTKNSKKTVKQIKPSKKEEVIKVEEEEILEPIEEKVEEIIEQTPIESINEETNDGGAENEALKAQLAQMQELINKLMAEKPQYNVIPNLGDREVVVGCRLIQGVSWGKEEDSAGVISLKYGEEMEILESDMKKFFRQGNIKKLFIDGLCYFADENDYAIFGIKKHIDLSEETLLNVLDKDINQIAVFLEEVTDSKRNAGVLNCIIFRVCDLIRRQKVSLDYYKRKGIESYLGMELDRGIVSLDALDSLMR